MGTQDRNEMPAVTQRYINAGQAYFVAALRYL
jgi:hypothetical protein